MNPLPDYTAPMRRALRLAERGRYTTAPNPLVGAVVLKAGGDPVGEGFHRRLGGNHAEVRALQAAGSFARGGTVVVNLEPCCHHGRTPPCTEALVSAGVARVVACHRDPNPRVSGRGFRRLRRAGIEVVEGVLLEDAVRMNLSYLVAEIVGRPAVTLKWAMSLDGRIATTAGESQWISSPPGRRFALRLREEHDALLVGSGTVLADDPSLNRRLGLADGVNTRVIMDRRLRVPPDARLFTIEGPVLLYTESTDREAKAALERSGATLVSLPAVTPTTVLEDLFRRGIRSVLVEGGGEVLASFVLADTFDRVAVCCAPLLIGGLRAPGPLGGAGFGELAAAARLDGLRVRRSGPDLLITGIREGCLPDLLQSVAD